MNKKLILTLALANLAILPTLAFAQPSGSVGSIDDLVDTLKSVVWTVFGALAVVMFVIAGITFMTAQGDPEKIKQARNSFLWGVAGVVVAILAYSIVGIVESML